MASKAATTSSVSFDDGPPPITWESPQLTASQKLLQKSKAEPFVPIGLAGTLATVLYGVYAYRNRGPMSTSRYIMKYRVLAQSAVVGAMVIGAALSNRK